MMIDPEAVLNAISYLIAVFTTVAVIWAFIDGNIKHHEEVRRIKERKAREHR